MEENSNEDTDKLVLNIINHDFEIGLREVAIDRTHRIGDPRRFRPIIAKFVRYYDREEVFSKKKHLKGKGISITESLKSFRKHERNMVLNMSEQLMVVSRLNIEMINQAYIMVNWLKHYGKSSSFVCVILTFICS